MDEPIAWFVPRQLNHRVKDLLGKVLVGVWCGAEIDRCD